MPEEITKVPAKVRVAREIKVLAAKQGKPMYTVVEEMLSIYKAATVETLPAPKDGKKVKLIKAARVH